MDYVTITDHHTMSIETAEYGATARDDGVGFTAEEKRVMFRALERAHSAEGAISF
jgi:hypothetical protein